MLEELFAQGLLKKSVKSSDLALKSLKQASYFLGETCDLIKLNKKPIAVTTLYNAMFHATRALLFKDGIKEKSHFAVARYLEYEYVDKKIIAKRFLLILDILRDYRHDSMYSLNSTEIDVDWKDYIASCRQFIEIVHSLIKQL